MLRFLEVDTNPGSWRRGPAVCRLLCSHVRGLAGNPSGLTVASSRYEIRLCSETLISETRHVCEAEWNPRQKCEAECLVPVGWRHMYVMAMDHFANQSSTSVVVAKCCFLRFVLWGRTCMCRVFTATLTYITGFLTVYEHQWLPCMLNMCVPLSRLWVIWTATIRSGWVQQP